MISKIKSIMRLEVFKDFWFQKRIQKVTQLLFTRNGASTTKQLDFMRIGDTYVSVSHKAIKT